MQTQKRLHGLTHSCRHSPGCLLQNLKARYIPSGARPQYYSYPYDTDSYSAIDVEVTIQEAQYVLEDIRKNSAPGTDHILYTTLRNLNDADLTHLVDTFNENF